MNHWSIALYPVLSFWPALPNRDEKNQLDEIKEKSIVQVSLLQQSSCLVEKGMASDMKMRCIPDGLDMVGRLSWIVLDRVEGYSYARFWSASARRSMRDCLVWWLSVRFEKVYTWWIGLYTHTCWICISLGERNRCENERWADAFGTNVTFKNTFRWRFLDRFWRGVNLRRASANQWWK